MPPTQRRLRLRDQPLASSIDPREVGKFSALAGEWWDPVGKLGPLHKINPVRLAFIRQECVLHFRRDSSLLRPFAGLLLLDIGCGGGLLSEPLARLGFSVTGADASEENVKAAARHAQDAGVAVNYRAATAEALLADAGKRFDVVVGMEIVEHLNDPDAFLQSCVELVKPGGLLFLATINRTLKSLALAKIGAEYLLGWIPVGTHDWNKFVTPSRLSAVLQRCGLSVLKTEGLVFDPLLWKFRRTRDTDVNYMLLAAKPNSPR